VKTAIVNRDEREAGERRLLNFGHTFGHAFERAVNVCHGEAVALGMAAAADLSVHRGALPLGEADRLKGVLEQFNLPSRWRGDPRRVWDALVRDKKRSGDTVKFVLLEKIGEPLVEDIPLGDLEAFAHDLCERG
jgi:3-dehydroquinate synthase